MRQQVVGTFDLRRIEVEHIEDFGLGEEFVSAWLEERVLQQSSDPDLGTRQIEHCWLHLGDRRLAMESWRTADISYQVLIQHERLPGSVCE